MKIIVAHEGKQHSIKTAEALDSNERLFKYITSTYNKPGSLTHLLERLLKGKLKKKIALRKSIKLEEEKVLLFCEFSGLFTFIYRHFVIIQKLFPQFYHKLHDAFGRKVALYAIENNIDAVIMYDYNANMCFKILKEKAPHIKRILDVTIANRLYINNIYHNDAQLFKDSYILKEEKDIDNANTNKRLKEELELAQYFLVGSTFVKKSLLFSHINENQIYIVPYGVNTNVFIEKKKSEFNTNKPLTLIFVGNVCYRKGIHHLLSVVSQYTKEEVILNIIGTYSSNEPYYTQYAHLDNIKFQGFVTHDELYKFYNQADVFVLPSLSEGFAQVSLEAMSCGLPVICTTNSGCNDVITDFKNGFIIEPSNREELKNRIDWFINNRPQLLSMGENARKIASQYTWDSYSLRLNQALTNIFQKETK